MRADAKADIAIVNSGSIRGNRVFPAGPLTRRTLIEIHPFDNVVCVARAAGPRRARGAEQRRLEAAGRRRAVSAGLRADDDGRRSAPAGNRVRDVRVNGQPLDPNKTYTVAIADYMLQAAATTTRCSRGRKCAVGPEAGNPISGALGGIRRGQAEIAPAVEGRITIR